MMVLATLLGFVSSGVSLIIAIALVGLGTSNVRRVHPTAGMLMAGAGAIHGFVVVLNWLGGFARAFGGSVVFTILQLISILGAITTGGLVAASLVMMAGAIKQKQQQQAQQLPYGQPPYPQPPYPPPA